MATLNNNQVATVLNTAIAMSTGSAEVGTLDLRGIIDNGNDSSVIGSVEQFTKSLINVLIRNWFTDSSYRSQYSDPFYEDTEKYGAIVQAISVDLSRTATEVLPSGTLFYFGYFNRNRLYDCSVLLGVLIERVGIL